MAEDDQEKTEDPTHRKLEDARKKGQVAFSREVSNFFIILALTLIVAMMLPWIMKSASQALSKYIAKASEFEVTNDGFMKISLLIFKDFATAVGLPLVMFLVAAIGSSVIQNGFHVSSDPITPKLDKISVVKGFGRMFSQRSFVEFIKGLIKISIVGLVAYNAIKHEFEKIAKTPAMDAEELLGYIGLLVMKILVNCSIAIFFIALLDFMYQKFAHIKQLKMTKQEIKEEYKQQEGDPHIKGKLKQMRMERARKRMMAAVPGADVVITNPVHYAVALKYADGSNGAPKVVAKGTDVVAERIKELARENDVPEVRNPVLARALHAECELEEEIPFAHYQAVAEVISYVYKLRGKK